jgi:GTP-binding protein
VTPVDQQFAELVRTSGKPVLLAANKCEGRGGDAGMYEAFSLGLGDPLAISAEHGEGIGTLLDAVLDKLGLRQASDEDEEFEAVEDEDESEETARNRPLRLAIVGRPNAGKSTLANALLGDERMITGPEPGLTRDTIELPLEWKGRKVALFDTAGLRRKSRIVERPEQLAAGDAINAIRYAEVVILLIDAERPFEKQDLQIGDLVTREGRALVVAINKWDLVPDRQKALREIRETLDEHLTQVRGVPVVTLSALSGRGLDKLMEAVFAVYELWNKRVPTNALNRWLSGIVETHNPPAVSGRRIRLRYMTQPSARPPTFVIFCSRPEELPKSYLRFLTNGLRETFGLDGVPVRLQLRKGANPYD